MRQHPSGLSLAKQALAQPFAFGFVREIREPDGLDSDDPADSGILGTVNHPGRSTAELAQNPVSADLIHANAAILSGWQNSPRVLWRQDNEELYVWLMRLSCAKRPSPQAPPCANSACCSPMRLFKS